MYTLDNQTINTFCSETHAFLDKCNLSHKELLHFSLTLEDILLSYQKFLGESSTFTFKSRKLFGNIQFTLQIKGEEYNPFEFEDHDSGLIRQLFSTFNGIFTWSYKSGTNIINVSFKKKQALHSGVQTLLAVFLGILLGQVAQHTLPDACPALLSDLIQPTLDTLIGIISATAGPMLFLSLLWGICTIGDVDTLSKMGFSLIKRFVIKTLLFSGIASLICYPLFKGKTTGNTSFQFAEFYQLILDIIPDNLITPFIDGNTQQMIFIAICCGIALLILGKHVSQLTSLIDQLNRFVQTLMAWTNKLIPVMVGLSVLKISMNGDYSIFTKIYTLFPIFLLLSLLLMIGDTLFVSLHNKVNPLTLVKKAFPAASVGFATASSAACFSPCLENSEKKMGIHNKLVNFGVPLGQALYKPGGLLRFVCVAFSMAQLYDVSITFNNLIIIAFICFLLAFSAPPVAGGAAICFMILLKQLGIPADALGITLTLNVFLDYILTGVNIYCLQVELVDFAKSMDMIDTECLKQEG